MFFILVGKGAHRIRVFQLIIFFLTQRKEHLAEWIVF